MIMFLRLFSRNKKFANWVFSCQNITPIWHQNKSFFYSSEKEKSKEVLVKFSKLKSVKEHVYGLMDLFPGETPAIKTLYISIGSAIASYMISNGFYVVDTDTNIAVMTTALLVFVYRVAMKPLDEMINKINQVIFIAYFFSLLQRMI